MNSLHITFGDGFSDIFSELTKHIQKYNDAIYPYFTHVLWTENDDNIILSDATKEKEIPVENRKLLLETYFQSKYNQIITIATGQTELKICLYVPLWDKSKVEAALLCAEVLFESDNNYSVDILGFAADTAFLFTEDNKVDAVVMPQLRQDVKDSINTIKERCANDEYVKNLIILQNQQRQGISLNLNKESLINLLGEYLMLYIEHYDSVFVSGIAVPNCQIKGIGFSVLNFDKYYFTDYLLSRTYLHIMDKEKIHDTQADVNAIANSVNKVINDNFGEKVELFTTFWNQYVVPKLDQKITDNAIVAQISPELDNFIDTLSAELQAFLTTNNFSLPQKRAALASLLGEDDELFSGNPYDKNIPIIDDCEYEAANIFVEFHNHINSCDDLRNAYAALANIADTGHVKLPLNEIKSLKIKIKNSTQTIRKLTAQMEEAQNLLDGNNMSSKVLIDGDVFTIGDEHFKILPTPVEKPLEETYEPKNQQLPQEIDLREKFTAIKNQGEIGSCTAFSSVGVYEYLAKRKERILNLSESFVYYYARTYQNNQNEDTGSSIHDAIIAMTEYGVCERSDWDYTTENIHQEPSQIAKDNAKNNTVTKALNVKHSINDFKSAISEGYPVCFSMKIFKSFGESHKGFITKPNAAELQSTSGYHAMVMCGYSDTNKVFIVRNSWGENFGDKGYCYIPYSYIEDEQLCSSAFLIKEISIGQAFKNVINNNNTVNFDLTDNYIRFAITRNLLEEEKHSCAINEKLYAEYRIKYYQITSALSNIAIREKLRDGESRYIGIQIDKDKKKEHELREEKAEKLNMFKGLAKKTAIYILCIIGLMLVSFYSVLTIKGFIKTVFSEYFLYNVAGIALLIGILIIAWKYYKYKLRKIESEWNEKIDEIGYKIKKKEQERDGLNLRSHIAGMIHDKIFSLKDIISKKHKIMKSYVLNLLQWYNEETDKQILMNNNDNLPFINIIENDLLDDYFNNEKDNISSGINLYDFINNYALTEDGIIQFKKDLENNIKQILDNSVSNFRMYDYIASITNYPYLNNDINNIYQLMNKMIKQMSQIFLRPKPFALNKDGVNFICVNNNGITHPNWNTALTNTFATLPEQLNLCLQNKIVIVQIIEFDTDELQIMV